MFEVYLYKNGVKQPNAFVITDASIGVPQNKYRITLVDTNHFAIKNLGMYMDKPVIVKCTSGIFSKSISIELRGVF